ncbi:MAG: FKBP-type peptidyl-prolyl cis-trans isomerase [Acidimicrobiales bacterium]|nr:FKBP-type peptidyl-prolyl cis-trans isomerase [Acidimicrobiales bacterium]
MPSSLSRRALAVLLASTLALAACGKSDDDAAVGPVAKDGMICHPTSATPTTKAPEAPKIDKAPTKVVQKDLKKGAGCTLGQIQYANMNLLGAKADGTVFTDTWASKRPLSVDPASGTLLPALAKAMAGMAVGGIRQITLPAADAYGAGGNPGQGIGPNEPLTFVVELFSVSKTPEYCRETAPLPAGKRPGKPTTVEMPVKVPTELETNDIEPGKGTAIKAGNYVKMDYVGVSCTNGQQFDSSWDSESTLDFTVGQGGTIKGMTDGIIGAKKGALRRIVIPSDMAYGATGQGDIGPNEALVFVVRIVDVLKSDPSLATTTTAAGATTTTAATTTTKAP